MKIIFCLIFILSQRWRRRRCWHKSLQCFDNTGNPGDILKAGVFCKRSTWATMWEGRLHNQGSLHLSFFHRGGKNGSNLGDFLNQGWSVEKVICQEMDQQSLYLDILLTSTYLSVKLEIYWQFVFLTLGITLLIAQLNWFLFLIFICQPENNT